MGKKKEKKRRGFGKVALLIMIAIAVLFVLVFAYFGNYYHAKSDSYSFDGVKISSGDDYVLYDGVGENDLLVFYPGAKVEFTAYAPLLGELASRGIDCIAVRMPLNFALFNKDAFSDAKSAFGDYVHYYIGGHSMGGAMAAVYASEHTNELDGLVLLAAYPTQALSNDLKVLEIYGSNDKVLNRKKLTAGDRYLPSDAVVFEISGGNHAQFGDYGVQNGDGVATVLPDYQRKVTVNLIVKTFTSSSEE